MKFWEISLVDFVNRSENSYDVLRRTVISLVWDDRTVPDSEQDVIEQTGKGLSEDI